MADAAKGVSTGVGALTDGAAEMGVGIAALAMRLPPDVKLDELGAGERQLAKGAQDLRAGVNKLRDGSQQLSAGLELLSNALPAQMQALEGSARGLASSVEPDMQIDAPVLNNGTGFAPNFIPVALWLGAVMTAFIFHLRRLPEAVMGQPRVAQLLGKLAIPGGIVLAQTGVILLMLMFMLNMRVSNLPGFAATMALASLTFLVIIVALNRAFGDVGKGIALILLILQLSSAGGVFPIELSSSFFQGLNPWLPFTWVVRAFRASMFGAYEGQWLHAWLVLAGIALVALMAAVFTGRWRYVGEVEHRPAMDI